MFENSEFKQEKFLLRKCDNEFRQLKGPFNAGVKRNSDDKLPAEMPFNSRKAMM
jgi:hypothetical protein